MRIVHIIPSLAKGGAERLVINISQGLKKSGDEVKIVVFQEDNSFIEDTKDLDIVFIPITYSTHVWGKVNCTNIELLDDFFNEFKPEIIHSHLTAADIIARVNPLKGATYITHLHGVNCIIDVTLAHFLSKSKFLQAHDHYLLNKLYKKTNTFLIAISHATYNSFYRNIAKGIRDNVSILYNCIDFERFKVDFNRVIPKNEEQIRFVNCGRTIELKNQTFLIDVIDHLVHKKGIKNCVLEIVGDGPLTSSLQKKVIDKKLENNIRLLGSVDDVEKCYADAHLYLHSALDGIFGLSTLEALSSGLPLVGNTGPDDGGNLIKNDVNGVIVQNNNLEKFVEGIERFLSEEKFYKDVSINNVELAFDYSIESYIPKLQAFYKSCASKNN